MNKDKFPVDTKRQNTPIKLILLELNSKREPKNSTSTEEIDPIGEKTRVI